MALPVNYNAWRFLCPSVDNTDEIGKMRKGLQKSLNTNK